MLASLWLALRPRSNPLAARERSWSVITMSSQSLPKSAHAERGLVAAERYVSRAELAALMGVSLATVDRLVSDGMPSVTWGRRTRRFRVSVAISWASGRGRAA
jgi:hypothetical protein